MSDHAQKPAYARREFLRGAARYALLAGILSATATALVNGRRFSRSCRRQFCCGGCPLANDCPLPEAEKFRSHPSEVKI